MNTTLVTDSGRRPVWRSAVSICLATACAMLLLAPVCLAQTPPSVVTLTFEGLKDSEYILNYYNGGYGSLGSGPGPNYGITFGQDSLAIVSYTAGGTGNFSGNPSGSTIAFFLTGTGVVMNVPQGFTTGFSFYYSAFASGSVTVYDGLNGTGNVLATINLPQNVFSSNCPTVNGNLIACNWQQSNNPFTGIARSVNFGGTNGVANEIGFDNITIGSTTATAPLVITNPPATVVSLPSGTVGVQYTFTLAATGGTAPYAWSATGLPPGLQVVNGAISGTPTTAGTYTVAVKVTDSTSPPLSATSQNLTLIINPASLTVTCTPLNTTLAIGARYTATCTASSGFAPYTWSSTNLPTWLAFTSTTGQQTTITGIVPNPPNTSYTYTVTVKGGGEVPATASATLTVNVSGALTVNCTPNPGTAAPGGSFSASCTAAGGQPPYSWSSPNPISWLTTAASGTNNQTLTLSGTVPSPANSSYSMTVVVTDSSQAKQNNQQILTINISAPPPTLTATCSPTSGTYAVNAAYSSACTASGGTAPLAWTFSGLPSWLRSSGTSGGSITLSGAVPAPPPTSYSVTVTVTDSGSGTARQTVSVTITINVAGAPTLTCSPSTGPMMVGIPYTSTCTVAGGVSSYTFSISAGSLPAGVTGTAAATTYTISGKPTAAGAYNYTAQVKDSLGQVATQAFSGTVSPAPSVGTFTLANVGSTANQATATLALASAPPIALSGTLCLTFAADSSVPGASTFQSQEVVFANGTTNANCSSTLKTSLAFTIAAGSTAAAFAGNSSQFSQGTVAGTITVTMKSLTDSNGNSVLPSPAPAQTISVAVAQPSLTNTASMSTTSSTVTVVFDAVTPKRSLAGVNYTFNSSSGSPITITVSFTSGSFAGMDQSQWFGTAASLATGGAFSLSATFPCTNCSLITGVQVTLSN